MEQIRCFIAIELSPELKAELSRLQNKLKSAGGGSNTARWVEPNGIHLTLKFLGNTDKGKIADITREMEQAVKGIPEFKLEVTELGTFPNPRRVQVVWVGVTGDTEKLNEIVKRLEEGLAKQGFKAEVRPFTPHLTLARVRETAVPEAVKALGEAVGNMKPEIASGVPVTEVCLMQSQLTPRGSIYTRLSRAKLDKNNNSEK
jgi:RNA 2',3'-cyclic 3'-phosphodiesterase